MPNIFDLFTQNEILKYVKGREFPAMAGTELFPERKTNSLSFDMIKGAGRMPVIASVHAFDTEAEIGSREASKKAQELAFIKRKMQLKEEDIVKLQGPMSDEARSYLMSEVYDDTGVLVQGVLARVEAFRMEALATGKILLNENGMENVTVDYGVPADNKQALSGTSVWTDETSDPIDDIMRWADVLDGSATRALTSRKILSSLLRHPKVIGALFGKDSARVASVTDLNSFMISHGLPQIATYDRKYRKQGSNGKYTKHRYFPENSFAMFGSEGLGETLYGPTPEESRMRNNSDVDTSLIGNVTAMMYEETKDPVGTWTKATATALPSFEAADEVFQATPIA